MLKIPRIIKTDLEAEVTLPASKSISSRYLMIRAIASGDVELVNLSSSHDVTLLEKALANRESRIDFEDAGTPLRLFLAYAALKGIDAWIDGNERLRKRPVGPLLSALEQLGAEFEYKDMPQCLPLRVKKGLNKSLSKVQLETGQSSQFLSALLLVAPCLERGLEIETIGELVSGPYVDLTMDAMKRAGVPVLRQTSFFKVLPATYRLPSAMHIESDWSAATFIYALAAVSGKANILLPHLKLDSVQGDKATAAIFQQLGVISRQEGEDLRILSEGEITQNFELDFTDIPDMFPAICAVCAALKISATFKGIKNLALKESDRVEAMRINLAQTGANLITTAPDDIVLVFEAEAAAKYTFRSFDDHRIAMACSIFALQKEIMIDDELVVKKSFPAYWSEFRKLTLI